MICCETLETCPVRTLNGRHLIRDEFVWIEPNCSDAKPQTADIKCFGRLPAVNVNFLDATRLVSDLQLQSAADSSCEHQSWCAGGKWTSFSASLFLSSSSVSLSDTQLCGIISPRLRSFSRIVYESVGGEVGFPLSLKLNNEVLCWIFYTCF